MDTEIMVEAVPVLGVCNLCLNEGAVKSMLVPYINMGKSEIYSEMLLNCFAIDISQTEFGNTKRLICIPCIVKLRECETFRMMVQQSLNTLRENAKLLKEEKVANIKEEFGYIGVEDNNFDDIIHKDDDFVENEEEEEANIKEEVCDIDIEDNDLDDIIHKDEDFDENEEEKEANIKEEVCDIDIEDNDLDDIIHKDEDFDENEEEKEANIKEEVCDIDIEDNDLDDIIHKDEDFDENEEEIEANIKEEVCDIDIEDNDLDDIIHKVDDFDENAEVRNIREEVGDIDNEDNDSDDIIHKDDDFDENAQIETTPCKVCGDEPTGLHFGVITCLACRAFFIRSLSRVEKYQCSRENACLVDRVYRNRCQYCRLQKCIKLGMSRAESIMSLSDLSISMSTSSSEEDQGRRRVFKARMNPLEFYNDEEFKNRYRMTKTVLMLLVNMIADKIKPFTLRNKSISALEQVLLTISFYATGAFQITVADHIRVHKSTACRIIKKVSAAIAVLRPQFITMPRTEQDRNRIRNQFYAISAFPNVIGAVDCTHIKIQNPGGSRAELYRNRKGYFSLNTQVICDANLYILDVICRWPGSVHDTTIINDSHIRADFESGVYGSDYLLGDNGYPCRTYLLTPFLRPSTPSEEAYNQAHIRTRNTVERCFGVLKRRFPCLSMGLRVKLETTMQIVVACCVLHNLALSHNDHVEHVTDMELNFPEDTIANSVSNENTSVRSSLVLIHFNR